MTIQEELEKGIQLLKEKQIEDALQKVRLLLCHILDVEKEYLVIHYNEEVSIENQLKYEKGIEKLLADTPIEYITNHREFMKLDFYVNENVLIPRQDTEITVEEVINYCKKEKQGKARVLDLCTGSGAIAISLAKYLPSCEIVGVDISNQALEVAKKNQIRNEVSNVSFICSDLFENVVGQFDVIVSNPPYIRTEVIGDLSEDVKKEPMLALDGGEDGLVFYKQILSEAPKYLKPNGVIFFEIGYDQKEEVIKLAKSINSNINIECKKDFGGNDRMIKITRK